MRRAGHGLVAGLWTRLGEQSRLGLRENAEGDQAFELGAGVSPREALTSDKSVAYGLRSLTRPSPHVYGHQLGMTLQIHSISGVLGHVGGEGLED